MDYENQIRSQWEIFRSKWNIPHEVAFNSPFDLSDLLAGGFSPERHFHGLPEQVVARSEQLEEMEAKS